MPVQVAVLQAAVVLLQATAGQSEDEQLKAAVEATVAHICEAMKPSAPAPGAHDSAWYGAPLQPTTDR
ncbi:hypothetical protein ACFC1D_15375 [Streptomyces vinaceus]|uniref:hypothetical protein n=1 Tax=Streptomyces vinaceus TaxID=1960 RepID=UPI0035DEBAFB